MRVESKSNLRFVGTAAIVAALILTTELLIPLGVAAGVPYVLYVLLGFRAPNRLGQCSNSHQTIDFIGLRIRTFGLYSARISSAASSSSMLRY